MQSIQQAALAMIEDFLGQEVNNIEDTKGTMQMLRKPVFLPQRFLLSPVYTYVKVASLDS